MMEHAVITNDDATKAIVLFDANKFDAFLDNLKAEVHAVPIDCSTKKGRDAIASAAAKVRSEKAAIDKDRLRLTKEWRDMTSQVNAVWSGIKEQLDDLAVSARAPLTEWEANEKARIEECEVTIAHLVSAATILMDDTAASVRERGKAVWNTELTEDLFKDRLKDALAVKDHTVSQLKAALARLDQEEADKIELARLRAEAAERERQELARRAEAEALACANAEKEAEERRKAEQERIDQERAARAAEEAALAERTRLEQEHRLALQAEQKKADDKIRAQQEELKRIADEKAAAEAERKRLADEQAARDADLAHRAQVKANAAEAIRACGASKAVADKIVMAIIAGEVPAVKLVF